MTSVSICRRWWLPLILIPAINAQGPGGADPYTGADEQAMAGAGYVSFGPFPFGTNHDSEDVQELLPDEPLRWLETAHFRIGCALPASEVGKDKVWATQLRGQLQQLSRTVPGVDLKVTQLDPWLRVHLIAALAEGLYAEVSRELDRSDADFPAAPGHEAGLGEQFLGLGPFLGLPHKFTILIVQRPASLAKYTAAHHSWATTVPTRHHDHRFGNAFFGVAANGALAGDEALQTHVAFHVAHNLYTSYRSYGHNLPAWLVNGLAHRQSRKVSTRVPVYDLREGPGSSERDFLTWSRRWTTMLKRNEFEPLPTFVRRMDIDGFSMDDHLQCWALVDFLMAARRDETRQFVERMKDPFHERLRFPTDDELFTRQEVAMRTAFGTDAAGLEVAWRRYRPTQVASR